MHGLAGALIVRSRRRVHGPQVDSSLPQDLSRGIEHQYLAVTARGKHRDPAIRKHPGLSNVPHQVDRVAGGPMPAQDEFRFGVDDPEVGAVPDGGMVLDDSDARRVPDGDTGQFRFG